MSSLNKKIGESNFLSLEDKIIIPNIDTTLGKDYFPNINIINRKLNPKFVYNNVQKEITENKYKSNKNPNMKICNDILKNKKDTKNNKIIEFCPTIKSTDTLNKKNNNFKSMIRNSRYKFHSLDSLKFSKAKNNNFPFYNDSVKKIYQRKNSDISNNLHLLSTSVKTNDLLTSKEIDSFQKDNIISDEYKGNKIKLFNQFFTPRFILGKQNNLVTNIHNKKEKNVSSSLNLKLSDLANKTFIKKIHSKNILNYKTYYNNIYKDFCHSANHSITFNNNIKNFCSKNLNTPNSVSEINEDDIETYKKEDSTINSKFESTSLININKISKKDIYIFEPGNSKNFDYIQSPIEFEYESDLTLSNNTITNEGNINTICSRLKNIEFHEIQKKKTSIENDTINYYDEMVEEDIIVNEHWKNDRNVVSKSIISKTLEMKKYLNNDNKILLKNKLMTFQNKKNIIKNSTNIKKQNRNIVEIDVNNHVNNKSFDIKNKSYFYIKKILEKPQKINYFHNNEHKEKNLMTNYVSNSGKMKINKEIVFSDDNKDEMIKKNKKININFVKLEQSEITTDTKSFKLNSIDDIENENTEEGYKTKVSEDDKSNNYFIPIDIDIIKK